MTEPAPPAATLRLPEHEQAGGPVVIALAGRLDVGSIASLWGPGVEAAERARGRALVIDAADLEYCDASGARFLVTLRDRGGPEAEFRGLRDDVRALVGMVEPGRVDRPTAPPPAARVAALGEWTLDAWSGLRELVVFTGQLCVMLLGALRRPRTLRLGDAVVVAERAGIGAMPIVVLIGFLMGLILSFQSAIPMRRFGAEVFVADLLGISLLREIGPLMAAILLAARSGSAFAAEIGTMKVNEEIDALTTMGLDPVRFLVVPRVLAALAVVPALTLTLTLSGLVGGALVFASLDFPLVTYLGRIASATTATDFLGGIFKAGVFGILVAGIGCLRGLQTRSSADAVGVSTTRSVVSGIVLIAFADGIFAVLFYALGI